MLESAYKRLAARIKKTQEGFEEHLEASKFLGLPPAELYVIDLCISLADAKIFLALMDGLLRNDYDDCQTALKRAIVDEK